MKRAALSLALATIALASCGNNNNPVESSSSSGSRVIYTASYYWNIRKSETESEEGMPIKTDNLLYHSEIIKLGQKLTPPTEPVREGYAFMGWYTETACESAWDFVEMVAQSSVVLYAKWGQKEVIDYTEPEYVVKEDIITDASFRLDGILNFPVSSGSVSLPTGAINRLIANPTDVKFALNYARKESASIETATYDVVNKKIAISIKDGTDTQNIEVTVKDSSASLVLDNSGYEAKAKNYEAKEAEATNYHVMLAGSSSIENWASSTADLSPIVSYNHGIGGTTVDQWNDCLLDRLIVPYSPKALVTYVGVNNIINGGDSGTVTGVKLVNYFEKVHSRLPKMHVFYIAINSLPGYANKQNDFDAANAKMMDYAAKKDWIEVLEPGKVLLKETGKPNAAYFLTDGLHMSQYGYVLWGAEIKKALMTWMG